MTDIDWTQFSDEELAQIPAEAWGEQTRRTTLAQAPEAINKINLEHLAALGMEPGDSWVKPVGSYHAPEAGVLEASQDVPLSYPKDWVVSYAGTSWKSLVHANVWEPGVANWADIGTDTNVT
jgi:hypothetical protein